MWGRPKEKLLVWFAEVDKTDIPLVGGKGANLGELAKAGLPVPPGFIVTAGAYFRFLKESKLDKLIAGKLESVDPEDSKTLQKLASQIQEEIKKHPFPDYLEKEIIAAYRQLGKGPVAVRSSATAEDLPDASFAGQQATFLNTEGEEQVIKAVRECWASLFEARAIYYRAINKFGQMKVGIAVPVQRMVQSEASGIMFTVDPVSGDDKKLVIDAGLGLGEAIVSGSVTPDHYVIDKEKSAILSREIGAQAWQIIRGENGRDVHRALTKKQQDEQKITDEQIIALAKLGEKIEQHYQAPQDTEWAIEGKNVYLVQSRPITTLDERTPSSALVATPTDSAEPSDVLSGDAKELVSGAPASLGRASGPVRVIHKPTEIDKVLQGDVLVTEMTSPDYVPAMRRAVAIVTDTGGRTSHAAIISRELGIPCIVGTGKATAVLKNGQMVTVDGTTGQVWAGKISGGQNKTAVTTTASAQLIAPVQQMVPVTATKIYLNIAEPAKAAEYAQLPVDGVGLMRAEFIISNIGEHPKAMVKAGRSKEYVDKLATGIATICQAFHPRPVVYRATDFKTNEYRALKGGAKLEPEENNPMIGYRGASRYIAEPELFALEMQALRSVREGHEMTNLHLMIPFVRTVEEYRKVCDLVHQAGLRQDADFKLWIMVEVPATVWEIDKYFAEGIDGVSIGSNDLTQLMLGVDRDSATLAYEFDERYPAVMESMLQVIRACRKNHVTVSICGQAPSVYPEITEALVKAGITSVSVAPDVAVSTRKLVASVEKKLLLNHILDSA